jgi:hypothetical protein
MPAGFVIDLAQRTVFSRAEGEFSYADGEDHLRRLLADPGFDPSFSQLFDFLAVTSVRLSSDEVRRLAETNVFLPHTPRAFVVSSDLTFALSRMFDSYRRLKGEEGIRIFRDLDEAVRWLGVTLPPRN